MGAVSGGKLLEHHLPSGEVTTTEERADPGRMISDLMITSRHRPSLRMRSAYSAAYLGASNKSSLTLNRARSLIRLRAN